MGFYEHIYGMLETMPISRLSYRYVYSHSHPEVYIRIITSTVKTTSANLEFNLESY